MEEEEDVSYFHEHWRSSHGPPEKEFDAENMIIENKKSVPVDYDMKPTHSLKNFKSPTTAEESWIYQQEIKKPTDYIENVNILRQDDYVAKYSL